MHMSQVCLSAAHGNKVGKGRQLGLVFLDNHRVFTQLTITPQV